MIASSPGATLTVGEGAVVTTSSVITSDVPPHTLVGNEKAKPLARATITLAMNTSYERFLAGLRPLGYKPRPYSGTPKVSGEGSKPGVVDDLPKSNNGSPDGG